MPAGRFWGAQTQRSLENFPIGAGHEPMPREIVRALAILKGAAARANRNLGGRLTERKASLIEQVCSEILGGGLDAEFPLVVWQTGSGTQTNMNVNEVVANRGNFLCGEKVLHPNDDVNMSQSSNDVFPSALHIAAAKALAEEVLPSARRLAAVLRKLEEESAGLVKCGRTHMMDAVPLTFAEEVSGWRASLESDARMLERALGPLSELAIGGTAVGTGLNAPEGFDAEVCRLVSERTGLPFVPAANKFHALTSHGEVVAAHGALKALAADLMKIAGDVRLLASGPRCGLGEIAIPANEPGSSIMPGKVNPTQCEAVMMVALQVMGNDAAIGFAAGLGNLELNTFQPVVAYDFLQSARLLAEAADSFAKRCAAGIRPNRRRMEADAGASLMAATLLSPAIGYEKAAQAARKAADEGLTLREACLRLGLLDAARLDALLRTGKEGGPAGTGGGEG